MLAAAGIVCREKGIIIGAAAAKSVLVVHRITCRPDRRAAAARFDRRWSAGVILGLVLGILKKKAPAV